MMEKLAKVRVLMRENGKKVWGFQMVREEREEREF